MNRKILNLTQHSSTPEQKAQGVFDLEGEALITLKKLLTFTTLPTGSEVYKRASDILVLASTVFPPLTEEEQNASYTCPNNYPCLMIGGAPYLISALSSLSTSNEKWQGYRLFHAFSQRESVEEIQPDGSIVKKSVFKHIGFVED